MKKRRQDCEDTCGLFQQGLSVLDGLVHSLLSAQNLFIQGLMEERDMVRVYIKRPLRRLSENIDCEDQFVPNTDAESKFTML